MEIVQKIGKKDLATVYIGKTARGRIEFVESIQPPFSRDEKWVLIISSLHGCPIECEMCDAGGSYQGKLTTEEILEQIDYLVSEHYPDHRVLTKKFKIQFARVGEPALNPNVLAALRDIPKRYEAPGILPSISTVAPAGKDNFFAELLRIKNELYPDNFQLQFSLHSTNDIERDKIIPIKKWSLEKIAAYSKSFYRSGDRKVTLNFILTDNYSIDPKILLNYFSPEIFFIKMTPLNPTLRATASGLTCTLGNNGYSSPEIVDSLRREGYEVLVSVGELEENQIGSNCGQYIKRYEEVSEDEIKYLDSYKLASRLRSKPIDYCSSLSRTIKGAK